MNINDNLKNGEVQSAEADSNVTILLPNYIMITYKFSRPTHLYVDEVTHFLQNFHHALHEQELTS